MLGGHGLYREPPARHVAKATHPSTNAEGTLPAELHGHKPKRLVAWRHKCEFGAFVDVGRYCRKLGLGEDSTGEHGHELFQFECCKAAVEVNDGTDADQLRAGMLCEDRGEDVGDDIDAFLFGPSPDEDE
jgi:hypothetical protein